MRREYPGEDARRGHDEADHRGGPNRFEHHPVELARPDLAIHHHGEHDRVSRSPDRGLGGREPAAHDSSDDDRRGEQGQQRPNEGSGDMPRGGDGIVGIVTPPGHHADEYHQRRRGEHPGNHPAQKHPPDRGVRQNTVDHHRDRGGNQRADHRRRYGNRAGESVVVTRVPHGADFHIAESTRVGQGGPRHPRKDDRGDNVHVAQTAPETPHQGAGEVKHPLGDPPGVHQVAGEDEEGHRQKRKTVGYRFRHPLRHHRQRRTVENQLNHPRDAQGKGNTHAEQEKQQPNQYHHHAETSLCVFSDIHRPELHR